MSFVIVTNGPALIAGSISTLKKIIGDKDPIRAAMLTAKIIPVPTTKPQWC